MQMGIIASRSAKICLNLKSAKAENDVHVYLLERLADSIFEAKTNQLA